jgi:DNA-binding MarR family transcriptional regulator
MDGELKQDLLRSFLCLKKANFFISRYLQNTDRSGLSATELSALNCLGHCCNEKNCGTTDQTAHNAMHETLAVSKAAVSQMLGSLEKRGYIQREIDRDNRRKIIITLTKEGNTAVDEAWKSMDALLSHIIKQFGEKDARHFVRLLNRFVEIVDKADNKAD